LAAFAVNARGDSAASPATAPSSDGEILPGWRFAPPDPGPTSALWRRIDLTDGERAYLDRAAQHANANAEAINTAFASAASERALDAMHSAAADQIGVDALGNEGVIP
jgi:hypothetical protein